MNGSDDAASYGIAPPLLASRPRGGRALIGAVLGGFAGGALWWLTVTLTGWSIGLIAVVVGIAVGYGAVTMAGGRSSRGIQVMAMIIAALAFVAATYFVDRSLLLRYFKEQGDATTLPLFLEPRLMWELIKLLFEPLDLLFFAITVYTAFQITAPKTAFVPPAAPPLPPSPLDAPGYDVDYGTGFDADEGEDEDEDEVDELGTEARPPG